MRQYAGWFCFVLLLGVVVGFAAGKWDATAQTVDNKSTRWLAASITISQAEDAFMLFDTQTHRLLAYRVTPTKRLELMAVREVSWDLKPLEYGKQQPTVKDMKELFDKSLKDEKKKKARTPTKKEEEKK
ncbi:MAG: hypothetical protein ACYTAF_11530 [Planctomycetota bacterium]|jgi:hypothetical protein